MTAKQILFYFSIFTVSFGAEAFESFPSGQLQFVDSGRTKIIRSQCFVSSQDKNTIDCEFNSIGVSVEASDLDWTASLAEMDRMSDENVERIKESTCKTSSRVAIENNLKEMRETPSNVFAKNQAELLNKLCDSTELNETRNLLKKSGELLFDRSKKTCLVNVSSYKRKLSPKTVKGIPVWSSIDDGSYISSFKMKAIGVWEYSEVVESSNTADIYSQNSIVELLDQECHVLRFVDP